MLSFVLKMQSLNDMRAIGDCWAHELKKLNIIRASYHMTPAFASQVGPRTLVQQYGFPEEAAKKYDDPAFRALDPGPDLVMQLAIPMAWREVVKGRKFTPAQKKFLAYAAEQNLTDGYAIPLYGPNGRDSYSSISLGRKLRPNEQHLLETVMGIGQIAHLRVCALVKENYTKKVKLSRRELDVLQWFAQSKSINDIATILDLAPATVDTYARRIFAKLGATSRLSAVAAGLRRGLIHL